MSFHCCHISSSCKWEWSVFSSFLLSSLNYSNIIMPECCHPMCMVSRQNILPFYDLMSMCQRHFNLCKWSIDAILIQWDFFLIILLYSSTLKLFWKHLNYICNFSSSYDISCWSFLHFPLQSNLIHANDMLNF